jgi:hypothetical protein
LLTGVVDSLGYNSTNILLDSVKHCRESFLSRARAPSLDKNKLGLMAVLHCRSGLGRDSFSFRRARGGFGGVDFIHKIDNLLMTDAKRNALRIASGPSGASSKLPRSTAPGHGLGQCFFRLRQVLYVRSYKLIDGDGPLLRSIIMQKKQWNVDSKTYSINRGTLGNSLRGDKRFNG